MTTDVSERGLEIITMRHMTGTDGLAVTPGDLRKFIGPNGAGLDGIVGISGIHVIDVILWHLPAGRVGPIGLGTRNKDLWRLAAM